MLLVQLKDEHQYSLPRPNVKDIMEQYMSIAKADFTVFKKVVVKNNGYYSPVRGYQYHPGYHYYQDAKKLEENFGFELTQNYLEIGVGIHAFTTLQEAEQSVWDMWGAVKEYAILKCTIPQGAKCFVGTGYEICTDNLIVEEVLRKQQVK